MLNTYWINNKKANIAIEINDLRNTKFLNCLGLNNFSLPILKNFVEDFLANS